MSFNISDKLVFIDSLQLLNSSLDNLVKNSGQDDFDCDVFELVKQKLFYPYEYISEFEKFKEKLASKEKFYSLLTGKEIVIEIITMFLRFGIDLK